MTLGFQITASLIVCLRRHLAGVPASSTDGMIRRLMHLGLRTACYTSSEYRTASLAETKH